MAFKTLSYSMPRGDSRSLPIAVPVGTYSTNMKIFFALKTVVDNITDDSSAVLRKTLTDADITGTDSTNVNYLLQLAPADTNSITPATYLAELEIVSADQSVVITYPDPSVAKWNFQITGEVNRRTS